MNLTPLGGRAGGGPMEGGWMRDVQNVYTQKKEYGCICYVPANAPSSHIINE